MAIKRKNYKGVLKWIFIVSALVIICIIYRNTLIEVIVNSKKLSFLGIIISILLSVEYYFLDGRIIKVLAVRHNKDYLWSQGIACTYYCGFYRLLTFGTGVGLAEIYYLSKSNIPVPKATGMSLVQYIYQKFTIACYGVVCFAVLGNGLGNILNSYKIYIFIGSLLTLIILFCLIVISTSKNISSFVIEGLKKCFKNNNKYQTKIINMNRNIELLHEESKELLNDKKRMLQLFLLDIAKITCLYLIPAVLFFGNSTLEIWQTVALMAICNMLSGVIPSPSGVGSLEYLFLSFFTLFTADKMAGAVILTYRFIIWILPFAIGGLLIGIRRNRMSSIS